MSLIHVETGDYVFLVSLFCPCNAYYPRLPVSSFLQRRRYTSINEHQRNAYQIYLLANEYLVCGVGPDGEGNPFNRDMNTEIVTSWYCDSSPWYKTAVLWNP